MFSFHLIVLTLQHLLREQFEAFEGHQFLSVPVWLDNFPLNYALKVQLFTATTTKKSFESKSMASTACFYHSQGGSGFFFVFASKHCGNFLVFSFWPQQHSGMGESVLRSKEPHWYVNRSVIHQIEAFCECLRLKEQ